MSDPTAPKLSGLQKYFLQSILADIEERELALSHLPEDHGRRSELRVWGVAWKTAGTPSERAVYSRALARLEARGLLLRQCGASTNARKSITEPPPARTTSVTLTPLGRETAKWLTSGSM